MEPLSPPASPRTNMGLAPGSNTRAKIKITISNCRGIFLVSVKRRQLNLRIRYQCFWAFGAILINEICILFFGQSFEEFNNV